MPEATTIERLFARIPQRYDRMNTLLSLGRDKGWRSELAKLVGQCGARDILDVATGTGAVAFALRDHLGEKITLTACDFCEEMLAVARQMSAADGGEPIRFVCEDALAMSFSDASFDAVTLAFGLRNFEDRAAGLKEIHRVLRPGGHLFLLEASQPAKWLRGIYHLHLRLCLPLLARVVVGKEKASAYAYLATSMSRFPDADAIAQELSAAGFKAHYKKYMLGAIALHSAQKI